MNNIISLAARVVRKAPQPAQAFYPIEHRSVSQMSRDLKILEELRIWMMGSDESDEVKRGFMNQYRKFMEPRV